MDVFITLDLVSENSSTVHDVITNSRCRSERLGFPLVLATQFGKMSMMGNSAGWWHAAPGDITDVADNASAAAADAAALAVKVDGAAVVV